jgi:hypothetical protein
VENKIPCWQVNLISVEFSPQNVDLLKKTVKKLGWEIDVKPSGEMEVTTISGQKINIKDGIAIGQSRLVNGLRVAYSQTVLTAAMAYAKEKGWQVQKKSDNKISINRGAGL